MTHDISIRILQITKSQNGVLETQGDGANAGSDEIGGRKPTMPNKSSYNGWTLFFKHMLASRVPAAGESLEACRRRTWKASKEIWQQDAAVRAEWSARAVSMNRTLKKTASRELVAQEPREPIPEISLLETPLEQKSQLCQRPNGYLCQLSYCRFKF